VIHQHIQHVKRLLKRALKLSNLQDKRFAPSYNVSGLSSHALQTARSNRGSDRESAIIIHGVMPRSGTNYIAALLRLHPDLYAFPNDIYEIPLLKCSGDILNAQKRFFQSYPKNMERIGSNDFLPLFGSSFIAYLHSFVPNGQRMLIKVPNVQYLSHFFSLFPHENLLVVMRDGRDLVSSTIKTWPQKKFSDVCDEWNCSTKMILGFNDYHSDKSDAYLMAKYEDVVRDPVVFVKNACKRFGLDHNMYPYEDIEKIPLVKPKSFNSIGRWHEWPVEKKQTFKKIAGQMLIDSDYCDNMNW